MRMRNDNFTFFSFCLNEFHCFELRQENLLNEGEKKSEIFNADPIKCSPIFSTRLVKVKGQNSSSVVVSRPSKLDRGGIQYLEATLSSLKRNY